MVEQQTYDVIGRRMCNGKLSLFAVRGMFALPNFTLTVSKSSRHTKVGITLQYHGLHFTSLTSGILGTLKWLFWHHYPIILMEVASLRPDHLPTLSATKASKLSLLFKSPFGSGAADVGNAAPTFCFSVPAISKLITLTVQSLWTAPTETAKHHIMVIDEAS